MDRLRQRLEQAHAAFARVVWDFRTGRESRLSRDRLERLDEEFGDVTQGELADEARVDRESAALEGTRDASTRLCYALERETVLGATRAVWSELAQREAATQLSVPGVPGRAAPLLAWRASLSTQPDAELRARIGDALDRADDELDDLRTEQFLETTAGLAARGHESRLAFEHSLLPDLEPAVWAERAGSLLELTEACWRDGLRVELAELGLDPAAARRCDEGWIARLDRFERLFPRSARRDLLAHATSGLRLSGGTPPGVELDLEARAGKHPAARCIAPTVPGDVRVSIFDTGGIAAAVEMLASTGEALALAFTSPELPAERRLVGDPAVAALWSELLAARFADPDWLEQVAGGPALEALCAATRQQRRTRLRRTAALARLEVELGALRSDDSPRPLAELYEEELTFATGCRYRRPGFLVEMHLRPLAVHQLRGACLEARVSEWLRLEFGRHFWRERAACELLKELWNTGTTYDAEGIASELGLGPIELEPLVESLTRS